MQVKIITRRALVGALFLLVSVLAPHTTHAAGITAMTSAPGWATVWYDGYIGPAGVGDNCAAAAAAHGLGINNLYSCVYRDTEANPAVCHTNTEINCSDSYGVERMVVNSEVVTRQGAGTPAGYQPVCSDTSGYGFTATSMCDSTTNYPQAQPPASQPTASLSASPNTVNSGGYTVLYWSSSSATSCSGGGFDTGGATSGSSVQYPGGSYTYSVTCSGPGGSATSYAYVSVVPPPPPASLPDLIPDQGTAIVAVPGQTISLPVLVHNYGDGYAPATNGVYQLCTASCAWYGEAYGNTAALGSGQSTWTYASYTFYTPGTYYYQFCADSWANNVNETNEGNNCGGYATITVGYPDITAGTGGVVSTAPNTSTQFGGTVTNSGPTAAGYFVNNMQTCDSGCATWNHVTNASDVGGLGSGASQGIYGYDAFPHTGTYYYRFCGNYNASWGTYVSESNYANNCSAWQVVNVTQADLVVGDLLTRTATAGTPVTLSSITTNSGSGSTNRNFHVGYAFDNQADHSTWYTRFGWTAATVGTLDAGGSREAPITYTFPSAGTYYVVACTDYDGLVAESNENNNCGNWVAVTVAPPIPPSPSAVNYSCNNAGTAVTISWSAAPGATTYYPRMYAPTASQCTSYGWQMWTDGTTCYPNPDSTTQTSFANFPVTPGQAYSAWVHGANSAGINPTPTYLNFSCAPPPAAACSPNTTSINTGGTVTYTANGNSSAQAPYSWLDSDGATGSGAAFARTYTQPGTYAMQVKAANTSYTYCSSQVTVVAPYCTSGSPVLSITASPSRVKRGAATTISWNASNVLGQNATCSVTGPGINWSGPVSGSATSCTAASSGTATINAQSTYTLTCGASSKSVIVNIIPDITEF